LIELYRLQSNDRYLPCDEFLFTTVSLLEDEINGLRVVLVVTCMPIEEEIKVDD